MEGNFLGKAYQDQAAQWGFYMIFVMERMNPSFSKDNTIELSCSFHHWSFLGVRHVPQHVTVARFWDPFKRLLFWRVICLETSTDKTNFTTILLRFHKRKSPRFWVKLRFVFWWRTAGQQQVVLASYFYDRMLGVLKGRIFWNLGVDLDPKKTWMSTWMEPFHVDPKNQRYFSCSIPFLGCFFCWLCWHEYLPFSVCTISI